MPVPLGTCSESFLWASVLSKGASPKGVTHRSLSTVPALLGETAQEAIEPHAGAHRAGPGHWPCRRWRHGLRSQARPRQWPQVSGGEEVGSAPSMTRGTAQLERWVVRAPSSCSPMGGGPIRFMSGWSPYPSVHACVLGCPRLLLRALPLHPVTSGSTQHLT